MASDRTSLQDTVPKEENTPNMDVSHQSSSKSAENSTRRENQNESSLKYDDKSDRDELSRQQIELRQKSAEINHSENDEQITVDSISIDTEMNDTQNAGCSTSSLSNTDHSGADETSSNKDENELNPESMDTNEPSPSSHSSHSSSTSSSSELEDVRAENNHDSESSSSLSSITSSSTSESDDDNADFSFISWSFGIPLDGDSSNDEQSSSQPKQIPEVLKKTLPADKFSFMKALTEKQWKSYDVRRKLANRFDRQIYASRRLVQRLELYKLLQKHNGCVNCVSFNDAGNVLVSSSDDRHVCLWDWSRGKNLLYFDSGHVANVLQAKFLPNSGDTKLVTCSVDNQIRLCTLDQCGLKSTSMVVRHSGSVHKLALQKQMPNMFLSAGEDGVIYSIDIRDSKPYNTKLTEVTLNNARKSPLKLYSIHCNPIKNYEFIACGNHKEVLLFDQRNITVKNPKPVITFMPINENPDVYFPKCVTSSMFNYNGTEVLSSHNDNRIYLFDAQSGKEVHRYDGHRNFETIKGVNFYGPHGEYIVSGSDCGHVFMWDKNSEAIVQWMKGDRQTVNCLEPHPSFPILATSGIEKDVKIWTPTGDGNDIENIVQSEKFRRITMKNSGSRNSKFLRRLPSSLPFFSYNEYRNRLPVVLRYKRTTPRS